MRVAPSSFAKCRKEQIVSSRERRDRRLQASGTSCLRSGMPELPTVTRGLKGRVKPLYLGFDDECFVLDNFLANSNERTCGHACMSACALQQQSGFWCLLWCRS